MGAAIERKQEQETGCMPKTRRVPVGRPLPPRDRRQQILRRGAGERMLQRLANLIERGLERHIVMSAQLACGAGYDEKVTARTTSVAINA